MSNKITRRQMLGIGAATVAGIGLLKAKPTRQITVDREPLIDLSGGTISREVVPALTGTRVTAVGRLTLNRCRRFFREKVTNP